MRALELATIAQLLDGHIDVRRRTDSIQPLRFPAAETAFYDPFTRWVAAATSGVRLRLTSDTKSLAVTSTQRTTAANLDTPPRPAAYDLFINGTLFARKPAEGGAVMTPDGGLMGDDHASVRFDDLPAGEKRIELWLPPTATAAITGMAIDDGAACAPWPDERPRVIFHGSSITHCMEADGGSGAWPAVACAAGDARLLNLGWAGSCLLSGLAARIIRDQPADAIVLKLGINVWAGGMLKERTFLDSAHAMISIIREKHPTTPMALISPIYSPGREDAGDNGGPSLGRMRELLSDVVQARVRSGDGAIRYLSGLSLFSEADAGDLPDNLHPNAAGYRRMGERFCGQALRGAGRLLPA